ncbi:response regulator [Thermodesulfobacteriota bacterium]
MSDKKILDGIKVLVVDDEQDILDVVSDLLDMCDVATASTFEEAGALLKSEEFDIVILDIMGVNGYGLLEIANRKSVPAVMLTAHAFTPGNLVRSVKEGAYAYIPKEEINEIADYLVDALKAKQRGENPWNAWQDRLPASYFEKRWGAAWQDKDREFWDQFKANILKRRSESKD